MRSPASTEIPSSFSACFAHEALQAAPRVGAMPRDPRWPLGRRQADSWTAVDPFGAYEFGNCGLVFALRHFRLTFDFLCNRVAMGNDPQPPARLESGFPLT